MTKVEQLTESQVMDIKKKHEEQFIEMNEDNQRGYGSENISAISRDHGEEGHSEQNSNE